MRQAINMALLGESQAMQEIRAWIRRVAPTHLPVLILGPTGCGKEVVARAIHRESGRRGKYVAINMSTVGEGVAESELFGHVKGAFTGAHHDRIGLLAAADAGTVLLDEINSCAPQIQAKLLRAIECQEFRMVGAQSERNYDFRVIAASNESLLPLVTTGRFRLDLLQRLSGVVIRIPPLVEHLEDLPALVNHFADNVTARIGRFVRFDYSAMKVLSLYHWPGNIRELKHVIECAAVLADTLEISAKTIHAILARSELSIATSTTQMEERDALLTLLQNHNKRVDSVASALRINRSTLYRRMRRLGITTAMVAAAPCAVAQNIPASCDVDDVVCECDDDATESRDSRTQSRDTMRQTNVSHDVSREIATG